MLLTFIVGLVILLLALADRFSRAGRLMRKIPGPQAWPIIGNALNYAVSPDKVFGVMRSLPKKYGHINQIHGLNTRIVNISNPEDIEKIMSSSEYNNKKMPYTFIAPWLSDGLLVSNGTKWLHRRKMLTKAFHFNILKKFTEVFKTGAQHFLKRVEKETLKDKTDVLAFISPTALRVMCETSMGLSMGEDTPAMKKYFDGIFAIGECFALRTSRLWLHNEFLFKNSSVAKTQKRVIEDLHEFTTKVVNDRRKMLEDTNAQENNKPSEKLAMLDLLLENEKLGFITSEGIREEVDTFLFEGFDTTSLTLTYMILAIANEPQIQNKIYEEMKKIFGDSQRMPTGEELNEMKYLENCIKETMRLYPAAPLIVRHLVNDTKLSGYTVPGGTDCFIFIYDMHRRGDIYPDSERFDPDRFLPENVVKRHPYAYVPFSAGQRNCIGNFFYHYKYYKLAFARVEALKSHGNPLKKVAYAILQVLDYIHAKNHVDPLLRCNVIEGQTLVIEGQTNTHIFTFIILVKTMMQKYVDLSFIHAVIEQQIGSDLRPMQYAWIKMRLLFILGIHQLNYSFYKYLFGWKGLS